MVLENGSRGYFPRPSQQGDRYNINLDLACRPNEERFDETELDSRHSSFSHDAFPLDSIDLGRSQDNVEMRPRQRPMSIVDALRQYCGIGAKRCFVAIVTDDGRTSTFVSPGPTPRGSCRHFFNEESFQQIMNHPTGSLDPISPDTSIYGHGGLSRQRDADEDTGRPVQHRRKKRRARQPSYDDAAHTVSKKAIKIGDAESLRSHYQLIFIAIQQNTCKLIAKAWIKLIEPRKQTAHPYTEGDARAPEWWPKPWGDAKDERVRHVEPDHQNKRERVYLLVYMLKMLIEPKLQQHEDIRHLGFNVRTFESATFEALSSFFSEDVKPDEKEKRARAKECLKELFWIAKQEQRYKNGEIDESATVQVTAWDKNKKGIAYCLDDEDEDVCVKDEPNYTHTEPSATHRVVQVEHRPAPSLQTPPFMADTGFSPPMVPEMSSHHHPGFVGGSGMALHGPAPGNPSAITMDFGATSNDSRRPSVHDYSAGGSLYPSQWPTASTAPSTPAGYPYAQQPANPHQGPTYVSTMPMHHPPAFLGSPFDSSARPGYDADPSSIYRPVDQ